MAVAALTASSAASAEEAPAPTQPTELGRETVGRADGDAIHVASDLGTAILGRVRAELARTYICYNGQSQIIRVMAVQDAPFAAEVVQRLSALIGWVAPPDIVATVVPTGPGPAPSERRFSQPFLQEFHQKFVALTGERGIDVADVRDAMVPALQLRPRRRDDPGQHLYNGRRVFRRCQPVGHVTDPGPLMRDVLHLLTTGMKG